MMEYRLTAKDITDEIMIEHFKRKGKTIIGTCGDCKYWNGTFCEAGTGGYNSGYAPDTFGCIHWEEKKND